MWTLISSVFSSELSSSLSDSLSEVSCSWTWKTGEIIRAARRIRAVRVCTLQFIWSVFSRHDEYVYIGFQWNRGKFDREWENLTLGSSRFTRVASNSHALITCNDQKDTSRRRCEHMLRPIELKVLLVVTAVRRFLRDLRKKMAKSERLQIQKLMEDQGK